MSKDTDPLKMFSKSDRLYCNVNNKIVFLYLFF